MFFGFGFGFGWPYGFGYGWPYYGYGWPYYRYGWSPYAYSSPSYYYDYAPTTYYAAPPPAYDDPMSGYGLADEFASPPPRWMPAVGEPPLAGSLGTRVYRYDGGPIVPVPMPLADPAPSKAKPAEGRSVKADGGAKRLTYAAFGDDRRLSSTTSTVTVGRAE